MFAAVILSEMAETSSAFLPLQSWQACPGTVCQIIVKIARFALDNWDELRQYSLMDTVRNQLGTLNIPYHLDRKSRTACSNNLIALLEQNCPGICSHFDSPARSDGSQKWVGFVDMFWHMECVSKLSLNTFTERYRKWCKRHGCNFSETKAAQIHADARQHIALVPKSDTARLLVKEAVTQLNVISKIVEVYRAEMNHPASQLPEYEAVMVMFGVGVSIGPQLMAVSAIS